MLSIEKNIVKEMTQDIEESMCYEDIINDIDDIMEDAVLGFDKDDIQVEESAEDLELFSEDINSGLIL